MADSSHDVLAAAASRSLDALIEFGFRLGSVTGSARGSTVEVLNPCLRLLLSADYLEGELGVAVQVIGGPELSVGEILGPEIARMTRISRGASRGILQARLDDVFRALVTECPELLRCEATALDAFR